MPLVSEVCEYLDELAPAELAEDWDNVGLLVGRATVPVENILTCLTLTPDVAQEALDDNVQLIVSHHPVLFRGAKVISDSSTEGRILLDLIRGGVAIYSAHTRFDSARGGINQRLAESLGLIEIQPIRRSEQLPELGSGRLGRLSNPVALGEFLKVVRDVTATTYVEYSGEKDAMVARVGVACGSAAEFLADAVCAGCDAFVTGEARFHSVLEARNRGVHLILPGHYASERPAMEWLATEIGRVFPDVRVRASERETDPLKVDR